MIEKLYNLWTDNPPGKKIMVLTGSGISVASGIDVYKKINRQYSSDFWGTTSQILSFKNYINNPMEIHNWTMTHRKKIVQLKPNNNHTALVRLENKFQEKFSLITTTIDNLHSHAGTNRLIELNGNIFKDKLINENNIYFRPDILLTGEKINKKMYLQAHMLAQQCDICLIIGSELESDTISELPMIAKKFNNAKIIEINPKKSYIEDVDLFLKAKAEDILPILVSLMIEMEEGFKNISSK